MSGVPILAAGSIMDHLAPRYEWHWPDFTFTHQPGEHAGMTVDLAAFNHWVEGMLGFNPDVTTHIVMLGFAAVFVMFFFIPISRSYVEVPKGARNFFEPILLYIRDEMVYPWLGKKDGRILLPYFWTIFFFILTCNLIGLLPQPFGITATGNFNITGALAVCTMLVGIVGGMIKKGAGGYWAGLIPPGVPMYLYPIIFPIELLGLITKHFALMVRLFANMTAGHAILAVLAMWTSLAPALLPIRAIQAGGSVAMVLFEVFISLVQAYIFTILSAIYIGLSLAEEH
jgi:F-type H+-transporting ATPase subunit a